MDADRRGWLSPEEARRLKIGYYCMCFVCVLQGLAIWSINSSKWKALERMRQHYEHPPVFVQPHENLQPVARPELPII